jgi:hypothetical protein
MPEILYIGRKLAIGTRGTTHGRRTNGEITELGGVQESYLRQVLLYLHKTGGVEVMLLLESVCGLSIG